MGSEHGDQPAHSVHRLSGRRAHQDRAGRRQHHQRVAHAATNIFLSTPGEDREGGCLICRAYGSRQGGAGDAYPAPGGRAGGRTHRLQRLETTASGCTADFHSQRPDADWATWATWANPEGTAEATVLLAAQDAGGLTGATIATGELVRRLGLERLIDKRKRRILPVCWFGDNSDGVLQLGRELASLQSILVQTPDEGSCTSELFGSEGLRINARVYNTNRQFQPVAHHLYRQGQVGVIGYDDSLFIVPFNAVHKKIGGQVNICPFLFCIPYLDCPGAPRNGCNQRPEYPAVPELSEVGREDWDSLQGPKVSFLTNRSLEMPWSRFNPSSEIPDAVDLVSRQDDCKVRRLGRGGGRWSGLGGRRRSWLAGAWTSGRETIPPGAGR